MTTLILVCLSTIATIVEKVVLVKSNKDKASRLGKKCEGWKVILAELQEQKAELPKTAEVNIMAIRDALVRNRSNLRAPLDVNEHRRRSLSLCFPLGVPGNLFVLSRFLHLWCRNARTNSSINV
jgi:hypothetical protein